MLTSARYAISYPDPATRADSADVPRDINSLVTAVEKSMMFGQGTLAARPAFGTQGRYYFATDNNVGYYDTGGAWVVPAANTINGYTVSPGAAVLNGFSYGPSAITAGQMSLRSFVVGEANNRFQIDPNGVHSWGPGGATAVDTTLSRKGANVLTTPGAIMTGNGTQTLPSTPNGFLYNPATATGFALMTTVDGEAVERFKIDSAGVLTWGAGGAAAVDTMLSRVGVGQLAVGSSTQLGSMFFYGGAATDVVNRVRVGADTQSRFAIFANGILSWGPGGSTAQDVEIARSAANTLRVEAASAGAGGSAIAILQADLKTGVASVTTARVGGAAAALPANPVRYLAMLDENGNRMYVPAYS